MSKIFSWSFWEAGQKAYIVEKLTMQYSSNMRTGIDIIEIPRIKKTIDKFQDKFLNRIFTLKELDYAFKKQFHYSHLAARFTAKEAVMKALGENTDYKDIEIQNSSAGTPFVKLSGRALKLASKLGVKRITISLSHSRDLAVANAILERGSDLEIRHNKSK